ncbi:MAG TPA: ESX secretion-associated protein EspG, partial [Pseudonocardiaceae bacterium]
GGGDPAWRAAEAMLRRPRTGAGYFVVQARGREAQDGTVTWFDTDAGRYAARGGTFLPVDGARLRQVLGRLIATA